MFEHYRRIHFVGIGGSGMSGIAEVLHNLGYEVTGSDLKESEAVRRLRGLGIEVWIGHRPENLRDPHVVVVSSAVSDDNPEVVEAKRRSIPVIPRAEMLAELGRLKYSILVAGAHGKTTTTSLISAVLAEAGMDPTVVIGGRLKATGSGASLGKGPFLVAEADESDGSFLKLSPTIAVATNIDREHMNFFRTMDRLYSAFREFLDRVPFYGASVVCHDDPYLRNMVKELTRRCITYGFSEDSDIQAHDVRASERGMTFRVRCFGQDLGEFQTPLIGRHNVLNALASVGVAGQLRIEPEVMRIALRNFKGVQRRFELKGEYHGVRIYDDYGHHPTEIRQILRAIRESLSPKRVIVIFQPHRYTRTLDLFDEFVRAFDGADLLYLLDIYPAGEGPIDGVSSSALAEAIGRRRAGGVYYIADRADESSRQGFIKDLLGELRDGDLVLTLGAGDVYKYSETITEELRRRDA